MNDRVVKRAVPIDRIPGSNQADVKHHAAAEPAMAFRRFHYKSYVFLLKRSHKALGAEINAQHRQLMTVKLPRHGKHRPIAADYDRERAGICNVGDSLRLNICRNRFRLVIGKNRADRRFKAGVIQQQPDISRKGKVDVPKWIRAKCNHRNHLVTAFRAKL